MIATIDFSTSLHADAAPNSRAARAAVSRQEALVDAALVQRFNAGAEAAFDEIVGRYHGRVLAIAQSLLGNHADAEEIAQDTFVRAHRGLAKFRGDSSLATWLHRIAVNLSRNRYWYFFRRARHTTLSLDVAIGDDTQAKFSDLVAAGAADPAREAIASDFRALVAEGMARLRESQRSILILRNADGLSYEQISTRLGITLGTVKSRIARAREMLRVHLAAAYPECGPDAQPADWFETIRSQGGIEIVHP